LELEELEEPEEPPEPPPEEEPSPMPRHCCHARRKIESF